MSMSQGTAACDTTLVDLNLLVRKALDLAAAQANFVNTRLLKIGDSTLEIPLASPEAATLLIFHALTQACLAVSRRPADRRVEVWTSRAEDGRVNLEVMDNGPAANGTSRAEQLRIAIGSLDLPGGCRVTSTVKGELNSLVVSFAGPQKRALRPGDVDPGLEKLRLLIIDDDATIVNLLQEVFRAEGCVLDVASDGYDGLIKLRTGDYDMVVLDMRLPRVDGELFLRASSAEHIDITDRVIAITADLEDYRDVLDALRICYMQKPFSIQAMVGLVREKWKQLYNKRAA
jgi:CheY-like chemotaxis protein